MKPCIWIGGMIWLLASCHQQEKKVVSCEANLPARFPAATVSDTRPGMVWVPGGHYQMGGDNGQASKDEYPKHTVTVKGFWMDKT